MELTNEQLQQSLDVNVMGTINTIRAFLKPMVERNSGHVVAVSSIAGFSGETFGLAYCPTKFAVRAVMECLQMEMRDRGLEGIVCSTVIAQLCPYFARTPMVLKMGMRPTSTLLSLNTARSLREYLGINYDTDCDAELINRRKSSPSEEYFSTSSMIWWFVASSVLVFIFLCLFCQMVCPNTFHWLPFIKCSCGASANTKETEVINEKNAIA
ncbi:hypothetical protein ANCCEY_11012 [Ancylostoma ceylanicum]|uniref:Oxidoreductase, short chain dehydrogenase/reductase family protein n=1 Tax=Ancylostoma ceylanicum TaxID=53326 RepID=A0A0D6LFE4_9BILA|nr:hypothetical protein ANCCEY_11012 [Ancylostoma ceylanicum]